MELSFVKFGKNNNFFKILLILQVCLLNACYSYVNNKYATALVDKFDIDCYDDYFAKENNLIEEMKYEDLLIDSRRIIRNSEFYNYQSVMKPVYYWAEKLLFSLMRPHLILEPLNILDFQENLVLSLNWTLIKQNETDYESGEQFWNYKFVYVSNVAEQDWLKPWRDMTNGILISKYNKNMVCLTFKVTIAIINNNC